MTRKHYKKGKGNKPLRKFCSADNKYEYQMPPGSASDAFRDSAPLNYSDICSDTPFGFIDVDVKAYFRTVDIQLRSWHDTGPERDESIQINSNEQRHLFFLAALSEMRGKELQLATDPECSIILERMTYLMDDFVRRVFFDSLTGSFEKLAKHRFASHVCQTMFTVARETVSRETRGVFPVVPVASSLGELRTMTQLILEIVEEFIPCLSTLITDPFASHVVRSALILLCPKISPRDGNFDFIRSRRSAVWKAKQGHMRSSFVNNTEENGNGKEVVSLIPAAFIELSSRIVKVLRMQLGGNEIRVLAVDKVASPGLQLLLQVEAECNMTSDDGSLMDMLTIGLINASRNRPDFVLKPVDYLNTILRHATSSHLFETIILRAPDIAFTALWSAYYKGNLSRLAVHPVANFVLAKTLERVSEAQLEDVCNELAGSWSIIIKNSKSGVMRAMIDRCTHLRVCESLIGRAICSAFGFTSLEDGAKLVKCILFMLPQQDYDSLMNSNISPTIQGSLLLQSLTLLSYPHNQCFIKSILSLSIEDRIQLAHDVNASWIYEALLQSSTVPTKYKNQFILEFLGHYHTLVNDRFGSRIGDRCWAFADTYLKEKVARSLLRQEHLLHVSAYGRFFSKKLNLGYLRQRPEEWRNMQANRDGLLPTTERFPELISPVFA